MGEINRDRIEALGPAEKIINTLIHSVDHMVHNRPGVVTRDPTSNIGVRWSPVTHKREGDQDVVYLLNKIGNKTIRTRLGIKSPNNLVINNGRVVGEYRRPGLYPEVAIYLYRQIAEVWSMDNELAARWASWSMFKNYKDLKVVLSAFLLVQNRMGMPIKEDGKVLFYDEDYREIGEAMCLMRLKGNDIDSKLLLRIGDVLSLPEIAQINRELGFGFSNRNPAMGRYKKVVEKWLSYREKNPKMLQGLVRSGQRKNVIALSQRIGYKPISENFFKILRWKQKQAPDGRRNILIGEEVSLAETWESLTEREICERIVSEKPDFKRITGLLGTSKFGLTRAIMAAAISSECLSNSDLVILTPTIEELGLLNITQIRQRWEAATLAVKDQRARNIAKNVKNREIVNALESGADSSMQRELEDKVRNLRLYFIVDKSGSMDGAIDKAKEYLAKFIQGFPLDKIHVSIFNSVGREIRIRNRSAAGVTQAFIGHKAGGGTNYGAGVLALQNYKPKEDEDAVMFFIGDQANGGHANFAPSVERTGINPVAFGLIEVVGSWGTKGECVELTARNLNIPCFRVEEDTFSDPYALQRTISNLIDSTPIGSGGSRGNRVSLIETILQTPLLNKPGWA